tara:strand:+ start:3329 stop:3751 length:423 start_codon:yes stop_codon:yes gene_type:complete
MNVLILQGPNLNLLGYKSSLINKNLTMDKLNRELKKYLNSNEIGFKIHQTHKDFQAINYLQRNRKWANGVLLIPTAWAAYHYGILETINLINLPTAIIYFDKKFSFGTTQLNSIMKGENIKTFSGDPIKSCMKGLDYIIK